MTKYLKGNYRVKKEVKEQENQETSKADTLKEKFKKRAIETVGGSMVFIEKDLMFWDGESEDESDKSWSTFERIFIGKK